METILEATNEIFIGVEAKKGYNSAILNILDDFVIEKERLQQLQRASLNLLDDMYEERIGLERTQRAIMNILEDIEAEQQRAKRSQQLLEAANKELEAFCYSVSHDLQAPLRAINGFAQVVVEDYASKIDPEGQRYLRLIQENSQLMGKLIQDLLGFSRLGRQQLSSTEIDMEKMAKEVFDDLKLHMLDRTIQFQIDPLPWAFGDPAMIHQVFVNLLSNALKFTAIRDVAMIEIGFRQEGDEGFYFVKDNGAGFDMRYVDKLFGVFQRLHTTEEFEGNGIGLALVKRIVTRHGGRIWAEGAVDKGACFYFVLPKEMR